MPTQYATFFVEMIGHFRTFYACLFCSIVGASYSKSEFHTTRAAWYYGVTGNKHTQRPSGRMGDGMNNLELLLVMSVVGPLVVAVLTLWSLAGVL